MDSNTIIWTVPDFFHFGGKLLSKLHSFDSIGNFKILDLLYEAKLIW
jgi:hypothetical protein